MKPTFKPNIPEKSLRTREYNHENIHIKYSTSPK